MNGMRIEKITKQNITELASLMLEMWEDSLFEKEYEDCKRILASETETCFLVKDQDIYIAFVYLSLRHDYVEGAKTHPVGYMEGLYVKSAYRNRDIGKNLVKAGETWCKEQGCTEFASDTETSNTDSQLFHKNVGFKEINRIVCFHKELK